MALFGFVIIFVVVVAAISAPWLAPDDYAELHLSHTLSRPDSTFFLGTDSLGRDVLSRIIWASRPSMIIGFVSVGLSMLIGVSLGLIAGYKGGRIDSIVMWFVNIMMTFPGFLLALMIVTVMGSNFMNVIIAIAFARLPRFIRLARAPVMSLRQTDYVEACKASGANDLRIMFRHILPNILSPIVIMATIWIADAIRTEASLSFLGLGLQPPTPSWGNMIREGVNNILQAPWLALYPGLAIMLTVLAFNMIGDWLRDSLDPREQI
jgi:peptide/nickel transport system permease protein